MPTSREPAAFFSYVHDDDDHDNGQISDLRAILEGEVRMQTGRGYVIFQDRHHLEWGDAWRDRVDGAIDAVAVLVPVITPAFFASAECRRETERFLERERSLERSDLILPIYYVTAPPMDDDDLRASDVLAEAMAARQYVDWRELRFEPLTARQVRTRLAAIAGQIAKVVASAQVPAPSSSRTTREAGSRGAPASETRGGGGSNASPVSKVESPTHVVDGFGREDFETIGAAIAAAAPGDRILVRPGLYEEGLVVDKPLEIIGQGDVADIVVRATGCDALLFQANIGRVSNLTLRQAGGDGIWYAVDAAQGRLELEDCDISGAGEVCVGVHDGADPRVGRNRIHHGGLLVYAQGLGTFEDNEVFGSITSGVEVREGGDPTMRRNRIHDGQVGVLVDKQGLGTFEDNEIFENHLSGIEAREGGNPTMRGNRIHRNGQRAIYVHDGGMGTFENNDLTENAKGPYEIGSDCQANVRLADNVEN